MSLESKTKILTLDLGINNLNEANYTTVLEILRNLNTPSYLLDKILLVYNANYHTGKMSFLFAINSNKFGIALAAQISPTSITKLSTTLDPIPTANNPFKYIIVPISTSYTVATGVWELFIGTSADPTTHNQYLFNNSYDLLKFYNHPNNLLASQHKDNYVIHHGFYDYNTSTSYSKFAKLGAPRTITEIKFE